MSQESVEAVRRSLDGWNRRDVVVWLHPFHPEIEWISEVAQRLEGSENGLPGRDGLLPQPHGFEGF